jgi:prepilin-type N-terminal cleavage/methylation domain-containing protein
MIIARKKSGGFTLVELMIVVAIIGILAAVAIPAFTRYVKKSRTVEAVSHLNKEWAGSVAYYETDHMNSSGGALAKQFPGPTAAADPYSTSKCCAATGGRCPTFTSDDVWLALNFSIPDPYNYKPGYDADGTGSAAVFTATATGDLDCDDVLSTFQRSGRIVNGDVSGSVQPYIVNELE